jgi:hypothetical protein
MATKYFRVATLALVLMLTLDATAQVTKVATFENFTEGQFFTPSFTDPLSGITFSGSTHISGGFAIDYSDTQFGGGNHLAAAYTPGPTGGWDPNFGFAASFPSPANRASLDVDYQNNPSVLLLKAFDSANNLVAQQAGPAPGAPDPFTLQVASSQFNIVRVQLISGGSVSTAYDNVSITVAPEPASIAMAMGSASIMSLRRRRHR